jgi:hypothetical protein
MARAGICLVILAALCCPIRGQSGRFGSLNNRKHWDRHWNSEEWTKKFIVLHEYDNSDLKGLEDADSFLHRLRRDVNRQPTVNPGIAKTQVGMLIFSLSTPSYCCFAVCWLQIFNFLFIKIETHSAIGRFGTGSKMQYIHSLFWWRFSFLASCNPTYAPPPFQQGGLPFAERWCATNRRSREISSALIVQC